MIHSRTHAKLDFGASAVFAGLALCPAVPAHARRSLAAASAYRAIYCALTDYEGGIVPRIGMAQHRALDLFGAAGLCLSGLFAGPGQGRALLLAAAATEVGMVALSDRRAHSGPPQTLYPPLDEPKEVAEGLFVVDSVLGPGLPVRMSVIRLRNGDLLLHSPTRFSHRLLRSLERLGPIAHLVAPNIAHWIYLKDWQERAPGARTWAAPGLRRRGQVRRSGLRIDAELSDRAPPAWHGEIEQAVVRGGGGFSEVAMLHVASRTLLMTDLVQNFEPRKLPWVIRALARLLGNTAPRGRAPAHLRLLMRLRRAPDGGEAARRIVSWAPDRVMVTHGHPFERDAATKLRRSLAWLTGP